MPIKNQKQNDARYTQKMRDAGNYYMSLWVPRIYKDDIRKIVKDFIDAKAEKKDF